MTSQPAKPAPPFLSDDQIERLAGLLDTFAVPARGFNLEALDGFLSALVVSPEDVPIAEWELVVWGGRLPDWSSPEVAQEAQRLLLGLWNGCTGRVRHGEDPPEHLSPLLWMPEDLLAEHPDTLDVGHDWALGFYRGVDLRSDAWDAWLAREDWIDEIFGLLERLGTGEVASENDGEPGTPVSYRERIEITASIPAMLADLHAYRIDQLTPREPIRREASPERNEACPCGSGKKYKKCHGG